MAGTDLSSWRDTATRRAIETFVASVTTGPDALPEEERVAVFDNDGTLWAEKPMPTQLHYLVQQWTEAVKADPALAERQPYKAVATGELAWLGEAIDKHYAGDDSDLRELVDAITAVTEDMSVEEYAASVGTFYETARHLTLKRPYAYTVYRPMIELLRYLEANGFACYIVSGGERDFMRPMTEDYYGIPPERVVGSAYGLSYDEEAAEVRYSASLGFLDDGEQKPLRIWTRVGRRPLLAVGNSNGDMQMLDYARRGPHGAALLIRHDDDGRDDIPYDTGAEQALSAADERGYTVVSVKDDWSAIFVDPDAS
ncbi:HAD family hydrolase [Humibacter soli]